MHRRQERAAKDNFRHDATNWMDLVSQLSSRICDTASGSPAVVMVESCAGYMGYPPGTWIVNLFRYSGVLTTKCALSQAREELPYPSGSNSTSDEAHLSRVCFLSQGKRQAWKTFLRCCAGLRQYSSSLKELMHFYGSHDANRPGLGR